MRPLTHQLPKPLIPLANTPLLDYHLQLLKAHGIKELAINLHHLPHMIKQHLGDGSRFGLKIHYSWEPELLGTGGGIKQMAGLLPRDTLVVLNSDMLTNIDLKAVLEFHRQHKALASMVLNPHQPLANFRGVAVDEQYRIHQIAGRPKIASSGVRHIVFAGIHIIEPELLDHIPAGKACCINADIYPLLIEQGKPIYAYLLEEGFWRHVGTVQSYLHTYEEFLAGKLPLKTELRQTKPGIWMGSNVSISPEAELIPPVMLGNNCQIQARVVLGPYVSLGKDCLLGEKSAVEHSILWEGVRVGGGAKVNRCVVANGAVVDESQGITGQLIAP
jgi:mannose-1-phosphate guanylyltransferase/phosphomannomutase